MATLSPPRPAKTLVQVLRDWAQAQPDRPLYTFLAPSGSEETVTYAQLDAQARAIASHLQSEGATGERVLLLYSSGLDYIAAFMGCLYAGAVAVPVYPPRPHRPLDRLAVVAQDAQARFVLSPESIHVSHGPQSTVSAAHALSSMRWLTTDALLQRPGTAADAWRAPDVNGETLAFLQYTSGSTAQPKGVMVSHANLLANHRMMRAAFGQDQSANYVSWLPLFHDMGLIGTVLHPLFLGSHCALMAPETFVMKPVRWLQAIARYGAHTSGGPNFAYDLCAQKVTAEQKATLDLSGWRVAFNGAEPVRATTLERFSRVFAECGFRSEAFYPCYGLAEATLFVSSGEHATEPPIVERTFNAPSSVPASLDHDSSQRSPQKLVSCGRAWLEGSLRIVDPETGVECAAGQVGEVWVRGPHVAGGYWRRPEATASTFQAYLAETGEGPFLRTGDLGFWHHGELYLVGRAKDLIIIAGRNYYPDELEQTVELSHPLVRRGGCTAFSLDAESGERLILVAEVGRSYREMQDGEIEITVAVKHAVAAQHELRAHDVVLLKPNALPRTSSGKVQRHACRAQYQAGTLAVFMPTSV